MVARCRASPDATTHTAAALGIATGVSSNVAQSMSSAWPTTPDVAQSWSITPQGTPLAAVSAR